MPRVRFLQGVAGDDFSHVAGDVVDMSGPDAEAWADGVRAELVRGETPETPERAAAKAETATNPTAQKDPAAAEEKPPGTRRRTRTTSAKPSGKK